MKLSEKGKENLQGFGFAFDCDGAMALLDDYEFEPDDFKGAVVLTVEEAKTALIAVQALLEICSSANLRRPKLWDLYRLIVCRIDRAEGRDET